VKSVLGQTFKIATSIPATCRAIASLTASETWPRSRRERELGKRCLRTCDFAGAIDAIHRVSCRAAETSGDLYWSSPRAVVAVPNRPGTSDSSDASGPAAWTHRLCLMLATLPFAIRQGPAPLEGASIISFAVDRWTDVPRCRHHVMSRLARRIRPISRRLRYWPNRCGIRRGGRCMRGDALGPDAGGAAHDCGRVRGVLCRGIRRRAAGRASSRSGRLGRAPRLVRSGTRVSPSELTCGV
jgi:hypothetical protein